MYTGLRGKKAQLEHFPGVALKDIDDFERVFKINITVFQLQKKEDAFLPALIRKSFNLFDETLYLNLFKNHFNHVYNLDKFSQSFICGKCSNVFKTDRFCNHYDRCKGGVTKHRLLGGVFQPKRTLRFELELHNINIPEANAGFQDFFCVFDFEAYLRKITPEEKNENDRLIERAIAEETEALTGIEPENITIMDIPDGLCFKDIHEPLSVSVCSNIPGYKDPETFINDGDSRTLIRNFLNYVYHLQSVAEVENRKRWSKTLESIEQRITEMEKIERVSQNHPVSKLKARVEKMIRILPVVSFNGGRYDLLMTSEHLLTELAERNELRKEKQYIIKKGTSLFSLGNDSILFCDITSYLSAGTSYDKYLKAFEVAEEKLFFPYNWVNDLDKLDYEGLPPRDAWFNKLTNSEFPEDKYLYCQKLFEEKKFKTFRSWLKLYNEYDVIGFVKAVEKQKQFYRDLKLDLLHDAVSLPGLCEIYLYQTIPKDTFFSLFGQKEERLFEEIRSSIVGGPSIIFCRKLIGGQSILNAHKTDLIKEPEFKDKPFCHEINGWDANSLYLAMMNEPQCTGFHFTRHVKDNFKLNTPTHIGQSMIAYEWLKYIEHEKGIQLIHRFGSGFEYSVGSKFIKVDGFDTKTRTVYQLNGCFWHSCSRNCGFNNEKDPKKREERRQRTERVTDYIKSLGHPMEIIWECEWENLKKTDPGVKAFLDKEIKYRGVAWDPREMDESRIRTLITSGDMFGFIKCTVKVPSHLQPQYSDFCPIFKNVEICRDDIGAYMKDFATKNGYLKGPRRALISSLKGENMWFATSLIKWYLDRGFVVSNIQEILQYEPSSPFKEFVLNVTTARRSADRDPNKAIIAETMKLLGVSTISYFLLNRNE